MFEGHDTILEPLGGKKNFILTILSSTDLTNQLAGYTVTVHSPCGDSGRVQIYQSGKTSAPNSCDAQVVSRVQSHFDPPEPPGSQKQIDNLKLTFLSGA